MKSPIPSHAKSIVLSGNTAWIWETKLGWNILQSPFQVDLEDIERNGGKWHTVDWINHSPRESDFEGGLAKNDAGHLEQVNFVEVAERIFATLRRRDEVPPQT